MEYKVKYEHGERVIEETGRFMPGYYEEVSVNDSSIWTRLVQEAGRKCDSFASDLLIEYEGYKRDLDKYVRTGQNARWLFGFRSSGVDPTEWVANRMVDGYHYISVFAIDLTMKDDKWFTLTLRRVK